MQNEELCKEKHVQVDYRLDVHDKRLDEHEEQIDKMKVALERLNGLILEIRQLISILKWFTAAIVMGLLTFFFYVIQTKLI